MAMNYSVSDVAVALDSVSQICDSGAKVIFHKTGGYIQNPTGTRIKFPRIGDTYARFTSVPNHMCQEQTREDAREAEKKVQDAVEHNQTRPSGAWHVQTRKDASVVHPCLDDTSFPPLRSFPRQRTHRS